MPRLKGRRSTRAPFAAATCDVASTEPSSTTTTSRPGSKARSSSITRPTLCSSFNAGTIAIRRSSRRRGSTVGGAALATVSLTRRRVASEEDADAAPPGGDDAVQRHDAGGQREHPRVEEPDAPAELEILLVEEELLREPAELAKELGADRERGAARGGDLAELGERVRRLAVAAGPGEAAEVHDVTARVQELGLCEQAQARLCDADTGVLEPSRERGDRAGLRDRVRVQEDERLGVRRRGAAVAAGAEAAVLSRVDHVDAFASPRILDLGPRPAVVHDDDFDAVGAKRVEAARQCSTAVVRHHDRDRLHSADCRNTS